MFGPRFRLWDFGFRFGMLMDLGFRILRERVCILLGSEHYGPMVEKALSETPYSKP